MRIERLSRMLLFSAYDNYDERNVWFLFRIWCCWLVLYLEEVALCMVCFFFCAFTTKTSILHGGVSVECAYLTIPLACIS